jgi:DNA-binding transcriptional MerR regulator
VGVSFSMSDVAKITGLHKNTIRNYIQRGELKQKTMEPIGEY